MTERDPFELADAQEGQADEMEQRSREVGHSVDETREDWERKRADRNVPGANPLPDDSDEDGQERRSPAPQAPPPSSGPGDAETPPEGGVGPPADVIDED